MAKTSKQAAKPAPVIVVDPVPDIAFGFAVQFTQSGRIVLFVRDTHAAVDEADLRDRIARSVPLPVGMRLRGLPCEADSEFLMECSPDAPFRFVAVAEPDTDGKGKDTPE